MAKNEGLAEHFEEVSAIEAEQRIMAYAKAPMPIASAQVGPPGVGKTAVAEHAGQRMDAITFLLHPQLDEPTDYRGLYWVVNVNGEYECQVLQTDVVRRILDAATANPNRMVWVIVDDLGQAPGAVQVAVAQFAWARQFNGVMLPNNVRVHFITNRRRDKAGVSGVVSMLTNRCRVLGVRADADSWAFDYMLNEELSKIPRDTAIRFAGFARAFPDCLTEEPNREMLPFCSARSLTECARDWNAGMDDRVAMQACIGPVYAVKLHGYMQLYGSMPDIDAILRGDSVPLPPKDKQGRIRADVWYAVSGSLAVKATKKNVEHALKYLDRFATESGRPEFTASAVTDMLRMHNGIENAGAMLKWLDEHQHFFLDVGNAARLQRATSK